MSKELNVISNNKDKYYNKKDISKKSCSNFRPFKNNDFFINGIENNENKNVEIDIIQNILNKKSNQKNDLYNNYPKNKGNKNMNQAIHNLKVNKNKKKIMKKIRRKKLIIKIKKYYPKLIIKLINSDIT